MGLTHAWVSKKNLQTQPKCNEFPIRQKTGDIPPAVSMYTLPLPSLNVPPLEPLVAQQPTPCISVPLPCSPRTRASDLCQAVLSAWNTFALIFLVIFWASTQMPPPLGSLPASFKGPSHSSGLLQHCVSRSDHTGLSLLGSPSNGKQAAQARNWVILVPAVSPVMTC